VTITSKHPTRHVQIVLRLYSSISEIITGFDVDCSTFAYDGNQVWASPRALQSLITQINTIDLTRRSPSYENRLFKYAKRGFEIYWPQLERTKIDPTIFERHFPRTNGLARLLVLEMLPQNDDRETYRFNRQRERGREVERNYRRGARQGNLKERQPEDISDWTFEDDYSSYHSFTIPYGHRFEAHKIQKLMYTRDLLLNAEWNKPKNREVHLHRHPCFIGTMSEILGDCCGNCPAPLTDEEKKVEEEERKSFVYGDISFIEEDPGRQQIGSFNPITEDDFTAMAYVGNTMPLCEAIVRGDLQAVKDWCKKPGSDVNTRDHTGRAPLHLAVTSSTLEIVQYLIDEGARITARVGDGKTPLHIAAMLGKAEIVRALLEKSEENEEEEADKEERRRKSKAMLNTELKNEAKNSETLPAKADASENGENSDEDEEDEDFEEVSGSESGQDATTQGSFVKVAKADEEAKSQDALDADDEDTLDVYDVNLLAWDTKMSPLHMAILQGHTEVVKVLVQEFGADVLIPWVHKPRYGNPTTSLNLYLATYLPVEKAKEMLIMLLKLGATSSQATPDEETGLYSVVKGGYPELVDVLFEHDEPAARSVMSIITPSGHNSWDRKPQGLLEVPIKQWNGKMIETLLKQGVQSTISYDDILSYMTKETRANRYSVFALKSAEENASVYKHIFQQPIQTALSDKYIAGVKLLADRSDLNEPLSQYKNQRHLPQNIDEQASYSTLLDETEKHIRTLKDTPCSLKTYPDDKVLQAISFESYASQFKAGSYVYHQLKWQVDAYNARLGAIRKHKELRDEDTPELKDRFNNIQEEIRKMEELKQFLISKGAKTGKELGLKTTGGNENNAPRRHLNPFSNNQSSKAEEVKSFEAEPRFAIPILTEKNQGAFIEL
jgi:ankyrin repeat protein